MNPPYPDMASYWSGVRQQEREREQGGFGHKDSRTSNFRLGWMAGLLGPSASGVVWPPSSVMCITGGQGRCLKKRLPFAETFRKLSSQDGITEICNISGDSF